MTCSELWEHFNPTAEVGHMLFKRRTAVHNKSKATFIWTEWGKDKSESEMTRFKYLRCSLKRSNRKKKLVDTGKKSYHKDRWILKTWYKGRKEDTQIRKSHLSWQTGPQVWAIIAKIIFPEVICSVWFEDTLRIQLRYFMYHIRTLEV